jgi:hypothetical protein
MSAHQRRMSGLTKMAAALKAQAVVAIAAVAAIATDLKLD